MPLSFDVGVRYNRQQLSVKLFSQKKNIIKIFDLKKNCLPPAKLKMKLRRKRFSEVK